MINVKNLKKTYFKGKDNEIKVINDTSLSLPNTGLISFLGASGSGKTTLLNTIGGLDKADSGEISYDNLILNKYKMSKIDDFRRKNIGYIFQNYLLLPEYSVYENLRIALELIDVVDKDEVNKRIEYALKAVGLYKFRKKLASNLSGGQQQRVSIARALIKKSKIIIADEPTGNLDSENTIEVMNILKKLSKEALVLIVTHSRDIAEFYSDYIVELKDGNVLSYNEHLSTGTLNNESDKTIHLLDYKYANTNIDNLNFDVYTDGSIDVKSLRVIIRNNTVFIDSDCKLQLIQDTNLKIENSHKENLKLENLDDFNYDTSWFNNTKKPNYFLTLIKELGGSYINLFKCSKKKKIFNFIFIIIGMIMGILSLFINNMNYTYIDRLDETNSYVILNKDTPDDMISDIYLDRNSVFSLIDKGIISDVSYEMQYGMTITLRFASREYKTFSFPATDIYPYDFSKEDNIIFGDKPSGDNLVIGKKLADNILNQIGENYSYKDLIGIKLNKGTIVGITNDNTSSIYIDKYKYYSVYDYVNWERNIYYLDENWCYDFLLTSGNMPSKDNETLIHREYADYFNIGSILKCNDKNYIVTGYFDGVNDALILTLDKNLLEYHLDINNYELSESSFNIVKNKDFKEIRGFGYEKLINYEIIKGRDIENNNECIIPIFLSYDIGDEINGRTVVGKYYGDSSITNEKDISNWLILVSKSEAMKEVIKYRELNVGTIYYSLNLDEAADLEFEKLGLKYLTVYDSYSNLLINENKSSKQSLMIVIYILLAIIIVYTYFTERAKMISEVYGIGVLRSLGAKRSKIIINSVIDLFAKISITTVLGYLIIYIIYLPIANKLVSLGASGIAPVDLKYFFFGILALFVIQIIVGLLPLLFLLRKTPSEINSKYDI